MVPVVIHSIRGVCVHIMRILNRSFVVVLCIYSLKTVFPPTKKHTPFPVYVALA